MAQDYRDECERVEVERRFSLAKRKCGMGLVTAKLCQTADHMIAMSVIVLNLRKIRCAFLCLLTYPLSIFSLQKIWTVVQQTLSNKNASSKALITVAPKHMLPWPNNL
ncbi:transposase [bacterium]|nr:transposase [bacterium]